MAQRQDNKVKVRYIYSACVVIETSDLKLCCDPWFTPGVLEGSWYQYPPLTRDPIDVIGKVDAIYVSHIHPDHYDVKFLKRYLNHNPGTQIIIGNTHPPHLLGRMRYDGLEPIVVDQTQFGNTKVHIFANNAHEGEHEDIDTALVVTRGDLSVANLNDNSYDQAQVDNILSACPLGRPTFAVLTYSGAGPYPQVYEFETKEALEAEAQRLCELELDIYSRYIEVLKPVRAMPFAGKYFLGGPLSSLNDYRAVSDATAVLGGKHGDISMVLADGGKAVLDLETMKPSQVRTEPYDPQAVREYLAGLPFDGYDYEKEIRPIDGRPLPILPLMHTAYAKAIQHSRVKERYYLCIKPHGSQKYMAFDMFKNSEVSVLEDVSQLQPRLEILIDPRHLFGLLTRLYHWDNAGDGSHYRAKMTLPPKTVTVAKRVLRV